MTGIKKQGIWAASLLLVLVIAAIAGYFYVQQSNAPLRLPLFSVVPKPTVLGWPVAISPLAGDSRIGLRDGPGAQARFADPFGLALDRAGNLFVADAGANNRIRKIAPDGTVSSLAGGREGFLDGTGMAAAFHTPSGIAVDRAGNLYVADTGNHAIRKVSPQGQVSTLAGSGQPGYRDGPAGQALFNGPIGVAVDLAGNVLVADTYNDRLRRIGVDGMVSTLAGTGMPGFLDGPAGAALFDTPTALAVAPNGDIFVADTLNGAIRKLGRDQLVSTLAQADPEADDALLQRPLALALAGDGVLYVADSARGRILQLTPAGQLHGLTGIGIDIAIGDDQAQRFKRPTAIVLNPAGGLLVADALGRVVHTIAPRAGPLAAPAPTMPTAAAALPAHEMQLSFPWPVAPQNRRHEVVGTIGEVRGSYDGESRHHFHNGLDVQANMGKPVLAVADEKVSSPTPNWGYGGLGEGLTLDSFGYIHMKVGRSLRNVALDKRFLLLNDEQGQPARVRIRRGTRFAVGDRIGTVNRMFHVHLVYRTPAGVANPLMLPLSGLADTIAPLIDSIRLFDHAGKALTRQRERRLLVPRSAGPLAIVVDAFDQTDGNAARRRLGLYKLGYQILHADGTPVAGYEEPLMNIEFNRLPQDRESVKMAYAENSGITVHGNARTRFLYVVTNTVRDGAARSGSWNPGELEPGKYLIRIFAADHAGNAARRGRDLLISIT